MSATVEKSTLSFRSTWQDLVVINFEIEPRLVERNLPQGLHVDLYNEHTFVSLAAMYCKDTVIRGMRIPFHSKFAQFQLRCYVKRTVNGQERRGVFFIKRYVPSKRVARLMTWWTGEPHVPTKIRRECTGFHETDPNIMPEAQYEWPGLSGWNKLRVKARSQRRKLRRESKDQFILDHQYAYYTTEGKTFEYLVEHPPWMIWDAASGAFECDTEHLFGKDYARAMAHRPSSVFLARGSDVTVYSATELDLEKAN